MLIFDSTGIQLGLAMTTSISPCIHEVNGGNRFNQDYTFFFFFLIRLGTYYMKKYLPCF